MRAATKADREAALRKAQRTLEAKLTALKRLVTSIQLWERRVKYYTAQLSMTDEERRAKIVEQAKRAAEKKQNPPSRRIQEDAHEVPG